MTASPKLLPAVPACWSKSSTRSLAPSQSLRMLVAPCSNQRPIASMAPGSYFGWAEGGKAGTTGGGDTGGDAPGSGGGCTASCAAAG